MSEAKRLTPPEAAKPEPPCVGYPLCDGDPNHESYCNEPTAAVTPPERAEQVTVDDGARVIRKIEACEGIAAKLVLLRQFGDRYTDEQTRELREQLTIQQEYTRAANAARDAFEGDVDKLEREVGELRTALKKISDNYGGCHCDHTDENCCEKVGEFCPHCISEIALREQLLRGK